MKAMITSKLLAFERKRLSENERERERTKEREREREREREIERESTKWDQDRPNLRR